MKITFDPKPYENTLLGIFKGCRAHGVYPYTDYLDNGVARHRLPFPTELGYGYIELIAREIWNDYPAYFVPPGEVPKIPDPPVLVIDEVSFVIEHNIEKLFRQTLADIKSIFEFELHNIYGRYSIGGWDFR